jgi:hypothetical protein
MIAQIAQRNCADAVFSGPIEDYIGKWMKEVVEHRMGEISKQYEVCTFVHLQYRADWGRPDKRV